MGSGISGVVEELRRKLRASGLAFQMRHALKNRVIDSFFNRWARGSGMRDELFFGASLSIFKKCRTSARDAPPSTSIPLPAFPIAPLVPLFSVYLLMILQWFQGGVSLKEIEGVFSIVEIKTSKVSL